MMIILTKEIFKRTTMKIFFPFNFKLGVKLQNTVSFAFQIIPGFIHWNQHVKLTAWPHSKKSKFEFIIFIHLPSSFMIQGKKARRNGAFSKPAENIFYLLFYAFHGEADWICIEVKRPEDYYMFPTSCRDLTNWKVNLQWNKGIQIDKIIKNIHKIGNEEITLVNKTGISSFMKIYQQK